MPEAPAPEVHADPDGAGLVGKDVHVVVATADRPELRTRLVSQAATMLVRHGVPRCVLEQRVIDGRVVRLVPAPEESR